MSHSSSYFISVFLSALLLTFLPNLSSAQINDPTISTCGGGQSFCATGPTFNLCIDIFVEPAYPAIDHFELAWEFGGNVVTIPGGPNPPDQNHTYTLGAFWNSCTYSIQYLVTLTTYPVGGVPVQNIIPITIVNPPRAQFNIDTTICTGEVLTVNSTACPTNNLNTMYDYGDGSPPTASTTHLYNAPGFYTITQTVTNPCGTDATTRLVHVINPAVAQIDVLSGVILPQGSPDTVCLGGGGIVNLSAINSPFSTTYHWTITPNVPIIPNQDTVAISIDFNIEDVYTIILRTNNACGQPAYDTTMIETLNAPLLTLAIQPDVCDNQLSYTPGQTFPDAIYTVDNNPYTAGDFPMLLGIGTHYIRAQLSNVCGQFDLRDTFVVNEPTAFALLPASDTICLGQSLPLGPLVTPPNVSVVWSGQFVNNGIFTPSGTGLYTITATESTCPVNQETIQVLVGDTVQVDLSPATICAGSNVDFCAQNIVDIQGVPISTTWVIPGATPNVWNGNCPQVVFNAPDTVTVSLTITTYCEVVTYSQVLYIIQPLGVTLPADTIVCRENGPFDIGALMTPQGLSGTWTGQYIDNNGTFSPPVAGIFVLAFSEGSCGLSASITVEVREGNVETTNQELCYGGPPFDLTSVAPCDWTDAQGNPVQFFTPNTQGTFVFTCLDTASFCGTGRILNLTVYDPAPAIAIVGPSCDSTGLIFLTGQTITFTSTSQDPVISWYMGDGTSLFSNPAFHSYSNAGFYNGTLVVGDNICLDTATFSLQTIAPIATPTVTIDTLMDCDSMYLNIDIQPFGPDYSALTEIVFDGNSTVYTSNPVNVSLPLSNIEIVSHINVTVSSICESVSATDSIIVPEGLFAVFLPDSFRICSGRTMNFSNISSGDVQTYAWYIDGLFITSDSFLPPQVFIALTQADTVEVMLIVNDGNICGPDTAVVSIVVFPEDIHAFINTGNYLACPGAPVTFISASSPGFPTEWNVDGQIFYGDTLNYTFQTPGTYAVLLKVFGCAIATDTVYITIHPLPIVNFTLANETCVQDTVAVNNLSDPNLSFQWDWPNGTHLGFEPSIYFPNSGAYEVTLTGTNVFQCTSSVIQTATILPPFPYQINLSDAFICQHESVTFNCLGANVVTWHLSNGVVLVGNSPTFIFDSIGVFDVSVNMLLTGHPCSIDTLVSITVTEVPSSDFSVLVDNTCELPILVTCTPDTIYPTYNSQWFVDGVLVSQQPVAALMIGTSGSHSITHIVTTAYGCFDSTSTTIEVYGEPILNVSVPDTIDCVQFDMSMAIQTNADSIFINFGDGSYSYQNEISHTYTSPGTYALHIEAWQANGCNRDTTINIQVFDRFELTLNQDTTIQLGGEALLFFTSPYIAIDYQWTPDEFLSCSQCFSPVASPHFSTLYTVNVENEYSCLATDSVWVYVTLPDFEILPEAFTPNGDGANDIYRVRDYGILSSVIDFSIYDRWGELIFNQKDFVPNIPENGWDGTFVGVPMPPGTYHYRAEVEIVNGETRQFSGSFRLIR